MPAISAARSAGPDRPDAGFALVDAMTSLLILSLTLGLAFQVGRSAQRSAQRATEAESARAQLNDLMETPLTRPTSGGSPDFSW